MDLVQIVLRVIHIGAGIFWVGSAVFASFFLQPAAGALGPQGGAVMAYLNEKRRLPGITGVSAVLTIAAGIWLYWRDSGGFDRDWISSDVGIGFTVGALAAIAAFVLGLAVFRPSGERMRTLLAETQGAPSPEQAQQIAALQERLRRLGLVNVMLLIVAVIAMASARFL